MRRFEYKLCSIEHKGITILPFDDSLHLCTARGTARLETQAVAALRAARRPRPPARGTHLCAERADGAAREPVLSLLPGGLLLALDLGLYPIVTTSDCRYVRLSQYSSTSLYQDYCHI